MIKAQIIKLIWWLPLVLLLTGCKTTDTENAVSASLPNVQSTELQQNAEKDSETLVGMLANPNVSFEIPVMYPSVMVDRVGYEIDGDKQALIIAETLPASFRVIDCTTKETVFEGNVKPTDSVHKGISTGVVDFSELVLEGTYYIETEILGCSHDFSISGSVYEDLLKETFNMLHLRRCEANSAIPYENNPGQYENMIGGWYTNELNEKDVVEGCLGIIDLLMAYEYHPKAFSDKMGIAESRNKIPDILDEARFEAEWLLKMQNSKTGGVYNGVSYRQSAGSTEKQLMIVGESSKATAYFCAAMAKFSLAFNRYDSDFAGKCMKAAGKAWKCLQSNQDVVTEAQMYRAAVEMYCATGGDEYRKVIEKYLSENADKPFESRGLVDAAISYMSSSHSIDVKACRQLMNSFLDRTLEKTSAARENPYGVENIEMPVGDMLRNTNEMVIVDYINTSRQYENSELAYLRYLCGRNETSTVYVKDLSNPDDCAKLLILLGRLTDK